MDFETWWRANGEALECLKEEAREIFEAGAKSTLGKYVRAYKSRPFWMKIRITQGPAFVGKDIYIPLATKNSAVARRMRDGIHHALKAGGFTCETKIDE